jgi:hypothetical protein
VSVELTAIAKSTRRQQLGDFADAAPGCEECVDRISRLFGRPLRDLRPGVRCDRKGNLAPQWVRQFPDHLLRRSPEMLLVELGVFAYDEHLRVGCDLREVGQGGAQTVRRLVP